MKLEEFLQSKGFRKWIWVVASLAVVLAVFNLGMVVGYHKARFFYRSPKNIKGDFMRDMMLRKDQANPHGSSGVITAIEGPALTIKGRNGEEIKVLLVQSTIIKSFDKTLQPGDLKIGNMVVVIGEPDESGSIAAQLIRIGPPSGPGFKGARRR